jgi:aspartate 1-decarboxylase
MMLSETTYTVNQHGTLKISRRAISEMGLQSGDTVRVAYLTNDGQANIFREFMLTKDGVDSEVEEGRIAIPAILLKQAGISENADVQVICTDGAIALCTDPSLNTEDLENLLHSLGIATDILSQLPDDTEGAIGALHDALNEEGASENDEYN